MLCRINSPLCHAAAFQLRSSLCRFTPLLCHGPAHHSGALPSRPSATLRPRGPAPHFALADHPCATHRHCLPTSPSLAIPPQLTPLPCRSSSLRLYSQLNYPTPERITSDQFIATANQCQATPCRLKSFPIGARPCRCLSQSIVPLPSRRRSVATRSAAHLIIALAMPVRSLHNPRWSSHIQPSPRRIAAIRCPGLALQIGPLPRPGFANRSLPCPCTTILDLALAMPVWSHHCRRLSARRCPQPICAIACHVFA